MTDLGSSTYVGPALDGVEIVEDLEWLLDECSARVMPDTVKWCAEWLMYVPQTWIINYQEQIIPEAPYIPDRLTTASREISFAKSLLNCKDFSRASYFLSRTKDRSVEAKFLYYWSRYLACMRDHAEHDAESFERKSNGTGRDMEAFTELLQDMHNDHATSQMKYDSFLLYLLACVEEQVGFKEKAVLWLQASLKLDNRLWPAWDLLTRLIASSSDAESFIEQVGSPSWISDWFLCHVFQRFNLDRSAYTRAECLANRGFGDNPIISSFMGACANKSNEHSRALVLFAEVRKMDPLRLDNMHLYSDSLFCLGERTALTSLTHAFFKTHKFTWQTCCIVGNYYTMRRDHEHAIRFFQRALRLNPAMAGIWVLIGHEFLEMKNNSAACLSYRKATEIDPMDYRGWYGLGQMYDILKMSNYALYYYQEAHKCRPQDSRILVALGVIYSKNGRTRDAQKCFISAFRFGDLEGNALWHLAKLFEKEGMQDEAARSFETYLKTCEDKILDDSVLYVLQFLAKHFCEKAEFDKAQHFAQRCLEHESISDEGRNVLRTIAAKKESEAKKTQNVDNANDADMQMSDGEDADYSFS